MDIDLKILDKRIGTEFPIPDYAKEGDAGIDLRAMIDEPIEVPPGDFKLIPTGIALGMNDSNIMAVVVPRSGLGTKGLVLKNTIGIIDSGYTGEIKLTPFNNNKVRYKYSWQNRRIFENKNVNQSNTITINPGDKIAQLIFLPIIRANFNIVDELGVTDRGVDGFGSTGVGQEKVVDIKDNSNVEPDIDWSQVSDDNYNHLMATSDDFREAVEGR